MSDSISRLKEGNNKFLQKVATGTVQLEIDALPDANIGQKPFAIILSCSDSRVPVELIFDQGFGDLFVVRVAGNLLADTQRASIEFAAQNFASKTVVVLGHSGCGAIKATLETHADNRADHPLLGLVHKNIGDIEDLDSAIRANVQGTVNQLAKNQTLKSENVSIYGAVYDLSSGKVEFLP